MKSKNWLKRQSKDQYVKKAKNTGFLSRASFKLIEIEKKYRLISKSNNILEIGSSPGGWSQVLIEFNPTAKIDAFDIIDMKFNHKNINFIKKNFLNYDFKLLNKKYDLILSDLAPNTTGNKQLDHLKLSSILSEIIFNLTLIADKKSNFIFKILKGIDEKNIINLLKEKYKIVKYFKPKSSRQDSSEIYIIAINFNH
tara:strand:- start:2454 stop:3044 length:591 start_codon:yes stop_codon:yes gene_type:complete